MSSLSFRKKPRKKFKTRINLMDCTIGRKVTTTLFVAHSQETLAGCWRCFIIFPYSTTIHITQASEYKAALR